MYEYRTASFFVAGRSHGHPIEEVEKWINTTIAEGWEYVELTQSAMSTGQLSVIVVVRKLAG